MCRAAQVEFWDFKVKECSLWCSKVSFTPHAPDTHLILRAPQPLESAHCDTACARWPEKCQKLPSSKHLNSLTVELNLAKGFAKVFGKNSKLTDRIEQYHIV
eukprot:2523957-Amphidinium_carterae.1